MSVPCTIPTTGSFQLMDFQGQCLTVDITGASPFAPVISEVCELRLPALAQQTWSLAPVNHGRVLVSGLSQGPSELVLLTQGPNGQAVTANNTGFGFNITCVPVDTNAVTLVDNLVGTEITLTSTQGSGQFNNAPTAGFSERVVKMRYGSISTESSVAGDSQHALERRNDGARQAWCYGEPERYGGCADYSVRGTIGVESTNVVQTARRRRRCKKSSSIYQSRRQGEEFEARRGETETNDKEVGSRKGWERMRKRRRAASKVNGREVGGKGAAEDEERRHDTSTKLSHPTAPQRQHRAASRPQNANGQFEAYIEVEWRSVTWRDCEIKVGGDEVMTGRMRKVRESEDGEGGRNWEEGRVQQEKMSKEVRVGAGRKGEDLGLRRARGLRIEVGSRQRDAAPSRGGRGNGDPTQGSVPGAHRGATLSRSVSAPTGIPKEGEEERQRTWNDPREGKEKSDETRMQGKAKREERRCGKKDERNTKTKTHIKAIATHPAPASPPAKTLHVRPSNDTTTGASPVTA
ncbi:hypothetical protein C8R45DRAFT_1072621 [Mycena sanguinolenta]|nr:hypothetical protein C8R45DRAFT_1072621 [Mycena sanguinolenta]